MASQDLVDSLKNITCLLAFFMLGVGQQDTITALREVTGFPQAVMILLHQFSTNQTAQRYASGMRHM